MKIPKEKTVQVTAILIHPGETIPMMFIIMMIRMITGRRTTGNNASKLWRQPKVI